ncbi:MAG: alcohol dehydrogenase catalytic domain-containing protein [Thaumarchaeota archaeon]|nr:alcohol dehydrogenase catalytic domain-containing protein [Nitrososphaerota archaeon]MCY3975727.1 alcohol dehydrogenase catalytic domain-containing protein [Nitrososphaerota archaeon]
MLPKLTTIPVHEIVNKIIEICKDVSKLKIGQKIGISPLRNSCMCCTYCNSGKENLCESADITGESLM